MGQSRMTGINAFETQPLSELNTTPLIDVLLVLLVMFIITIPVATHSVPFDLPQSVSLPAPDPVKNRIVLDEQDRILWNGAEISKAQLAVALSNVATLGPEPEVQFEPEATANYAMSAAVLDIVKRSGITKFGFTGNHKYQDFGTSD